MKIQPQKNSQVSNATILFQKDPSQGLRNSSGHVVFDEHFKNGRLCTRYWSPNGQVWPETYVGKTDWTWDQPGDTFLLAVDERPLAGEYTWVGAEITPDPSDYRGEGRPVRIEGCVFHHTGLTSRLENIMSSELLLFEAVK